MTGLRGAYRGGGALLLLCGCVVPNPDYVPIVASSDTSSSTETDGRTETDGDSASDATAGTAGETGSTTTTEETSSTGGFCGDGLVDPGEECDEGENNGADDGMCSEDCTLDIDAECGNGQTEQGEECDDGNNDNGDGCDEACALEPEPPECGNGDVEEGEQCDDGNLENGDGCEDDCTWTTAVCGNGEIEDLEECDDGNDIEEDGCEPDCTLSPMQVCIPQQQYISCDQDLDKGDPMGPFHAIGVGCSDNPEESILISNEIFNSPDPSAWQLARGFGNYHINNDPMEPLLFSAREGESLLMLSTGKISGVDNLGVVVEPYNSQEGNGENANPDEDFFLPNFEPDDDQSGTLPLQWEIGAGNPNDKIWMSFQTTSPPNTKGFQLAFALQSAEWPVYVNTTFNDLFIVWLVTDDFTGNIAIAEKSAMTITSLHHHWTSVGFENPNCANFPPDGAGYSCNEPQLSGTGFETHGATRWLRLNYPLDAGETIQLAFWLADMADTVLATQVLLDRFRWRCEPCLSEDDPACDGDNPDTECCGLPLPK